MSIIQIIGDLEKQIHDYTVFLQELNAEPEIKDYARKRLEYLKDYRERLKKSRVKSAA